MLRRVAELVITAPRLEWFFDTRSRSQSASPTYTHFRSR
jgi:hypothetical protein